MPPPLGPAAGYAPPEGGWGWAVVAGAFISIGFSYAFPKSITVFFKEIEQIFDATPSQVSWISSIMLAVMYAGGELTACACVCVYVCVCVFVCLRVRLRVCISAKCTKKYQSIPNEEVCSVYVCLFDAFHKFSFHTCSLGHRLSYLGVCSSLDSCYVRT